MIAQLVTFSTFPQILARHHTYEVISVIVESEVFGHFERANPNTTRVLLPVIAIVEMRSTLVSEERSSGLRTGSRRLRYETTIEIDPSIIASIARVGVHSATNDYRNWPPL